VRNRREVLASAPGDLLRVIALDLADAVLDAVDPVVSCGRAVDALVAHGVVHDGCLLLAFGKAAIGMTEAALARLSPSAGIVLAPRVPADAIQCPSVVVRLAGHPEPAADAAARGREVLSLVRGLGPDDVVLCLVSGGGSAMLEVPAPGVSLADLVGATRQLLAGGATISELNAVRACLSDVKGGRLAAAIRPARIVNVVIADAPSRPLSIVASGPTMAPFDDGTDPIEVAERYGLPASVLRAVRTGAARPRPIVGEVRTVVAADNGTARAAAMAEARQKGLSVVELEDAASGEARAFGPEFVRRARATGADVVVAGGETTVRVTGAGRGGRNQELVASVADIVEDDLVMALGTDGVDGASEHAGAVIDLPTIVRARAMNMSAAEALADNDTEPFFARTGSALVTGPTGTNVADVCVFVRRR
jgi:hydroxypyruvate reductase